MRLLASRFCSVPFALLSLTLGCQLALGCQGGTNEASTGPVPSFVIIGSPASVAATAPATATSGTPSSAAALPAAPPAPSGALVSAATLLTIEWADAHASGTPEAVAAAAKIEQAGYLLYKKRKDLEAVALYEQSLSQVTNAAAYYRYANSLTNVKRLPESIKGYELALHLGFPSPEAVHYNLACAYSRMENAPEAFAALARAVDTGYGALEKLKTDPDLAYLRARPEWEAKTSKFRATPTQLRGTLVAYGERDFQQTYSICPDGRVFEQNHSGLDDSCCGSTRHGTLSQKGDKYVIAWSKKCGFRGLGGHKFDYEGEGCQPYKGCAKTQECKSSTDKEDLVAVSEVAGITRSKLGTAEEPGSMVYVPAKTDAQLPKLCASN